MEIGAADSLCGFRREGDVSESGFGVCERLGAARLAEEGGEELTTGASSDSRQRSGSPGSERINRTGMSETTRGGAALDSINTAE